MRSHINKLLLTALFLGWVFDFLFWGHTPGISFFIYVMLCVSAGVIILRSDKKTPAMKSLWLLLPITFFSLFSIIRQEPFSLFLAYSFTLFCMMVLAITFLGGRWSEYLLADYVIKFFDLGASMLARPFNLIISKRSTPDPKNSSKGIHQFWSIIRGILIALPVLAIFAGLLASADMVFAQRMENLISLLRLEKLPEYIFRGVFILVIAYILVGVFNHAATRSKDSELVGEGKKLIKPFLGFQETAIVLISVILLFISFVGIQFQYLFNGQSNIHLEGFTYAEYARRGFFELITVAFFSLLLLLGLSAIVRRRNKNQNKAFSLLGIVLVLLVGVILFSAHMRLSLYEDAYGFSRLRTYAHIFIVCLGLLLATVVILEIFNKQRIFTFAAFLSLLIFAASINLLNVDAFISQHNINRAIQGKELDVSYLSSLSSDAIPTLVNLFNSPMLPVETQGAVGSILVCMLDSGFQHDDRSNSWRSFTLSDWIADRSIRSVEYALRDYKVVTDDWSSTIISPAGNEYQCNAPPID